MNFLKDRTIEVRVGVSYSNVYPIENGVPQGSVCSPILFNIMINEVFSGVDDSIGRSLYADDGAIWVRGRNVAFVGKKLQAAVSNVENWGNRWGFRFSVDKTQVIVSLRNVILLQYKLIFMGSQLSRYKI